MEIGISEIRTNRERQKLRSLLEVAVVIGRREQMMSGEIKDQEESANKKEDSNVNQRSI